MKFAGAAIEDPRPRERYVSEAKRLLAVVDKQLEGKDSIAGDFSINGQEHPAPHVNSARRAAEVLVS